MSVTTLERPKVTAEIVDRLEAILERDWTQGTYGTFNGPCCLAGACGRVVAARDNLEAEQAAIEFGLPAIILDKFRGRMADIGYHAEHGSFSVDLTLSAGTVMAFNDHSETTLKDVLDVVAELRPAAA